jgi:hypothetical protein
MQNVAASHVPKSVITTKVTKRMNFYVDEFMMYQVCYRNTFSNYSSQEQKFLAHAV